MKRIRLNDAVKSEEVFLFPFDPLEYPLNIEVCGSTESHAPHMTINNPCRSYIIEYIVKGSGTLQYNGKVYHPQAGDLYVLCKGSNNSYYPDEKDLWTKLWINIDGILVPNLLSTYGFLDTVLVKGFQDESLFRRMLETATSDIPMEEIVFQVAIQFHEILQKAYRLVNRAVVKNDARTIKQLLDANIYKADFTIQGLSEQLHISQPQLINIFKEKYGQTPYRYLLEQRIQVSAFMLINTPLSIKAIADTLNFADQHYYSNVFKRIIGMPPQQYRIKNQRIYNEIVDLSTQDTMKNDVVQES